MFNLNKNDNKQEKNEVKQPVQAPSQTVDSRPPTPVNTTRTSMNEKNVIGEGTEFEGTLKSNGDIRIDGKFVGTITSEGKLSVSNSGSIEGDVFCKDAEFDGEISGNIKARGKVLVKPKAHIKGDVRYYDLQVEPGAHIACTISRLNPESEKTTNHVQSATKTTVATKADQSIAKNIDASKAERKKSVLPLEEEMKSKKNGVR